MKKKVLSIAISMMLLATLFAGCQSTPATPSSSSTASTAESTGDSQPEQPLDNSEKSAEVTIYTYYAEASGAAVDAALVNLKEMYPNVTFHIEHRTDADGSVLRTRAAVGELPEIMELTGALTETFVKSGDILSLDDTMNAMGFKDRFIPNVLDGSLYADGSYYAVGPDVPENAMFFYNKTVFEEHGLSAPKNIDEFRNIVTTLRGEGIIPLALFGQEQWPGLQMYDLAVLASGNTNGIGALENGVGVSDDPAYLNAATKVREMIQLGLIGDGAFSTNSAQAMELVKLGQAGMYFCGSWYFGDCAEYGDNIDFFDYNPFSDPGAEEDLRWYKSGGAPAAGGWAVSAHVEDPEFIKEIAMNFVIERTRGNTTANAVVNMLTEDVRPDSPRSESYERYATDVSSYVNLSKYGWGLENPELYIILQETTEKLLTGTTEPSDYISELEQRINAI